jgi:5'-deoxynucleotidase YfbR-like HD superfamily hydrolase
MSWIETWLGYDFEILNPDPAKIDIRDIGHAIARINRYTGHIDGESYSVAEHAVKLSEAMERDNPGNWQLIYDTLNHDDSEAYIGDISRPLKALIAPLYKPIEAKIEKVIAAKFGLTYPAPAIIKEYDTRILLDEKKALLHNGEREWNIPGDQLFVKIEGWSPNIAEWSFLERFRHLQRKIKEAAGK